MEGTQHGADTRRFGNDTLVHTGLFQHLRIWVYGKNPYQGVSREP